MQWPTEKKYKKTNNELHNTTQKTKDRARQTPCETSEINYRAPTGKFLPVVLLLNDTAII